MGLRELHGDRGGGVRGRTPSASQHTVSIEQFYVRVFESVYVDGVYEALECVRWSVFWRAGRRHVDESRWNVSYRPRISHT